MTTTVAMDASVEKRFWSKIQKSDSCWIWIGAKGSHGYGELNINHKPQLAHRLMWTIRNGPIPAGMEICHTCDNHSCVNPDHLFLGTHKDNMNDMAKKGHGIFGIPNFMANNPEKRHWGEKNGQSKLTALQIVEIRKLYSTGEYTTLQLGKSYGVSRHEVGNIVSGRRWSHME